MEVSGTTLFFIQVFLFLMLFLGILFLFGYFFMDFSITESSRDLERKTEIARLSVSAGSYYGRMNDFEKVCKDIGLQDGYVCNSNLDSFVVETQLTGGDYYCADSAGFRGQSSKSVGQNTSCYK